MKRILVMLAALVIVAIPVAVPIALFVTKEEASCYPERNGSMMCYTEHPSDQHRWYATKTDYAYLTGLNDTNASEYTIPGCQPVMLYMYARHSVRFPDFVDLVNMSEILHRVRNWTLEAADQGKTKLCKKDIEELRHWEQRYKFNDAAQETRQGSTDTSMIAERFKKMFPSLFPPVYSDQDYKLGYSDRERTNQTLQAFLQVIFDKEELSKIEYPPGDIELVSFHKNCERKLWPNHTKPKRELFEEPEKFRRSLIVQRFLRNLQTTLGIEDKELSYHEANLIAIECALSYAAYGKSPWCAVFSSDDLLVSEYDDDIYDFYKDGYGRPLNPKMGCPVVNEVTQLFNDAANKPKEHHYKSVLYFTHSRDFKKLLGSFDLFIGDDRLTADGYCTKEVRNRIWRDSTFSPYSAQLVFILFQCGETYKVLSLLNEKPVKLPRCAYHANDFLCDLREFYSKYRVKNCDINKICTPSAIYEKWPDTHWEDA
ncbi:multiple inositol polyphosphate phosphatase 1-like [Varroa jacobsoni]|uniref:multiple inositol polyphosphate phosphatase 1-like n=1 Tax=Varroa jacobsoni TaxID=62625 RepID=UPI000BF6AF0B|nr:multiple inositol polyphosphate phosphatase 1-like [Varroa jacobsoni]